jgi:hypothetical protein
MSKDNESFESSNSTLESDRPTVASLILRKRLAKLETISETESESSYSVSEIS